MDAKDPRLASLTPYIRDVPDFPKPGILFKDITPLLSHGPSFRIVTQLLGEKIAPARPELLVGVESRGFIFGAALASSMGLGFVPVRKPGKLPYHTTRVEYALEYGKDALEMHKDAIPPGARVVIVDDLLATGGTAGATVELVKGQGGVVAGLAFVIELAFLSGRQKLAPHKVDALIQY
jgi:adenine phosphoribosyltransferase